MRLPGAGLSGVLSLVVAVGGLAGEQTVPKWSLSRAVEILNSSAWARHETFTRVVEGVGSGVSGEKEIFNTFYVRFLSATPIREAFVRIQQIQYGYDKLGAADRLRFDSITEPVLKLDVERWIVVAVGFRSNDPNEESTVRRFFQKETAETLKNKAFLSTDQFPQVSLAAYFPPREEGVGAKFVFPRTIDTVTVVSGTSREIVFELLDVPGASPRLRASFSPKNMVINGVLII